MNVCTTIKGNQSGFIFWAPGISVPNYTSIHPIDISVWTKVVNWEIEQITDIICTNLKSVWWIHSRPFADIGPTLMRQAFVTTCLRSTTSTRGSMMATLRTQVMSKPYTFSHPGEHTAGLSYFDRMSSLSISFVKMKTDETRMGTR